MLYAWFFPIFKQDLSFTFRIERKLSSRKLNLCIYRCSSPLGGKITGQGMPGFC